jgi:hypothetical protein
MEWPRKVLYISKIFSICSYIFYSLLADIPSNLSPNLACVWKIHFLIRYPCYQELRWSSSCYTCLGSHLFLRFLVLVHSSCVFSKRFEFLLTLDLFRQADHSPITQPTKSTPNIALEKNLPSVYQQNSFNISC